MTAVGASFLEAGTFFDREVRRSLRSVDGLITALILPVMILTMFVFVFGGAMDTGGRYIDYVLPGVLFLCAGHGAANTAVSVAQDMEAGTIDRFRTLPIARPSVLVGHVSASVARNLVASTLVVGFGFAYGWRPSASPTGWLVAVALLTAFILAFTWVACALGLVVRPDAASGLTFVMLFLPYVSSGFVPPETMPVALRGFAEHQPLTPIIETMRSLLTGGGIGTSAAAAFLWLAGITAVGFGASVLAFRRRS